MGEGSEGIAASGDNKNDGLDSCEANNVSCSSKKDRRVSTRTVG